MITSQLQPGTCCGIPHGHNYHTAAVVVVVVVVVFSNNC